MTDRTLSCCDCGREFAFTAAEQEFFRERGLTNDPKRCLECRKRRRRKHRSKPSEAQRSEGGRPGRSADSAGGKRVPSARRRSGSSPPSGDGESPPTEHRPPPDRPLHDAVCAACGTTTQVPFEPDGVRPVYCLPCLKKQTRR